MNLENLVRLFLLEDRAISTRMTYERVLNPAVRFFGPGREIALVTREDILRYIAQLWEQPARYANHPRRPAEQGGLAPRTVEKQVKTLVTFFRWVVSHGYCDQNPAENLRLRRFQRPPGSSKAATPQELQALLRIAEAKARLGKTKHLAILLFLADTGSRAGEAASLTIANLLLDQLGAWVVGKGDKMRPVFYGPRTADVLRTWLDEHPHPTPDALVFDMRTASALSQVIERLAQNAGIKRPLHAHAIRHRVGQVWSSAKLGEQATQMKLGHDDPAVTIEMYYNTTWEHIQVASQDLSLAAIFGLPSEPPRLSAPVSWPNQHRRTG